jgi:phosphoglycolate phosphatase
LASITAPLSRWVGLPSVGVSAALSKNRSTARRALSSGVGYVTAMSARRPTVLLFDIDGTLLLTGGAGRRAFEGAFAQVLGRADAVAHISFAGMTDLAIARAGIRALGLELPPEAERARMDELVACYVELLAEELVSTSGYRIMPGVEQVLDGLVEAPRLAIGLGTGNVKRGAQAKLEKGGLWQRFTFGGFGCDAELRAEVLRAGAVRGAAELGEELAACRVVVIGDTPKDVEAALAIGAECVGVETGGVGAEALYARGARAVFSDLRDGAVLDLLLG